MRIDFECLLLHNIHSFLFNCYIFKLFKIHWTFSCNIKATLRTYVFFWICRKPVLSWSLLIDVEWIPKTSIFQWYPFLFRLPRLCPREKNYYYRDGGFHNGGGFSTYTEFTKGLNLHSTQIVTARKAYLAPKKVSIALFQNFQAFLQAQRRQNI